MMTIDEIKEDIFEIVDLVKSEHEDLPLIPLIKSVIIKYFEEINPELRLEKRMGTPIGTQRKRKHGKEVEIWEKVKPTGRGAWVRVKEQDGKKKGKKKTKDKAPVVKEPKAPEKPKAPKKPKSKDKKIPKPLF